MIIVQRSIVIILVLLLMGCTVTLAPPYDKDLVDGIKKTNTDVMTFFALMSGGTKKETFDQRNETYASLIGRFDTLAIHARIRLIPKDAGAVKKIGALPVEPGGFDLSGSETPSFTALLKISGALTKMREVDQKQGVTAVEVQGFKREVSIFLTQALVYENFLKR